MRKEKLAKMAQESLDNAMEMIDNLPDQTNCWIPFYIGKAWAMLELLQYPAKEEP